MLLISIVPFDYRGNNVETITLHVHINVITKRKSLAVKKKIYIIEKESDKAVYSDYDYDRDQNMSSLDAGNVIEMIIGDIRMNDVETGSYFTKFESFYGNMKKEDQNAFQTFIAYDVLCAYYRK